MSNGRLHTAVEQLKNGAGQVAVDMLELINQAKQEFATLVTLMTKRNDPNDTADIDSQSGEIETVNKRLSAIHDQMTDTATSLKQAASAAQVAPPVPEDEPAPALPVDQDGDNTVSGGQDTLIGGTGASGFPSGPTGAVGRTDAGSLSGSTVSPTAAGPGDPVIDPASAWAAPTGPTGADWAGVATGATGATGSAGA